MPYSTTPITSGSAKFSTLDPDSDLFLEENSITVGANPANPAVLYDYDTSTLNISHIVGNNGEVNLSDSDLIGVNQFVCKDYLSAVSATASDHLQWTITLNDITGSNYTKKFRVPSNFVNNCSVKIAVYATNANAYDYAGYVFKYDNGSYTNVGTVSVPANTTTPTEFTVTLSNINPGELYCIRGNYNLNIYGASGVKILCDLNIVTGGYWAISD